MHILLVKTSSLGDVIHNLPVVSDLHGNFPGLKIDWCVEESFAEIPRLHPGVGEVIPVAMRRWRKSLFASATWREISAFRTRLSRTAYDAVLDTQGLIKSALLCAQARGVRYGYAAEVAREPLAAFFYDKNFVIPPNVHAVERNRWLGAAAFDYPVGTAVDYGLSAPRIDFEWLPDTPYAVLLTATSRDDKLWDEAHWIALAQALHAQGLASVFPSGSRPERLRAERLAAAVPGGIAVPPLGLRALSGLISRASLAVGVDTGLVHLAAALKIPTIALYVSTDPSLTGVYGRGFFRNLGGVGQNPAVAEVLSCVEQAMRR